MLCEKYAYSFFFFNKSKTKVQFESFRSINQLIKFLVANVASFPVCMPVTTNEAAQGKLISTNTPKTLGFGNRILFLRLHATILVGGPSNISTGPFLSPPPPINFCPSL